MPIGRDPRRSGIHKDDPRHVGLGGGELYVPPASQWGAYGARYYRQVNCIYRWAVKITKGGSTWLFGHSNIKGLSDGFIYGLLADDITVDSKVDYVTKKWSVQDVAFSIINQPYKQDPTSHAWIRFADEVGSIRGALIYVYLLAGPKPTALADGLLVFSGEIQEPASVTRELVRFSAVDAARRKNLILPRHRVTENTAWTGIPIANRLRKIPLTYGEFTKAFNNSVDLGLARAELVGSESAKKFTCSDHVMHTLSKGFIMQNELPMPSEVVAPTLDTDDSGYGTAIMTGLSDARMYAEHSDDGDLAGAGHAGGSGGNVTYDAANAGDLVGSTKARTQRTASGLGGLTMRLGWRDFASNETNTLAPIGKIIGEDISGTKYGYLKFRVKKLSILTSPGSPEVHLVRGSGEIVLDISTFGDDIDVTAKFNVTEIANVLWHFRSGDSTYTAEDRPILFTIFQDGTLPLGNINTDGLYCYYCYLQWRYRPYYVAAGYVAGKGRIFGSWIDTAGRSNSYSAGDLIEDPAFIIESILRDELGLGDTDIDTDSFDAAADAGVKARISIHSDNETDAFSIIRQIAEQSRFAIVITGSSKIRLVPLNVTSPTIARTLTKTDIDLNTLQYGKDSRVINNVRVKHRWQEEHQDFADYDTYVNNTEFSDLFSVDFKWQNITDDGTTDSVFAVAGFIRDTWGVQRNTIKFTCPGIANVDLTVGDWFQIDPTSVDPFLLCYGASWSGKKFLISRVTHSRVGTKIEAVQLI